MKSVMQKAEEHCTRLLLNSRCKDLPFHNLEHTLDVYNNVKKIGFEEGITKIEVDLLSLAALFHDLGYTERFEDHEELSAAKAESFMKKEKFIAKDIHAVQGYILATKTPQRPMNIMERIICDADLFHLGRPDFYAHNERLRTEWEDYLDEYYTDHEWYSMNIDFLQVHDFHTTYGKIYLEPLKQENITLFELFITNMNTI